MIAGRVAAGLPRCGDASRWTSALLLAATSLPALAADGAAAAPPSCVAEHFWGDKLSTITLATTGEDGSRMSGVALAVVHTFHANGNRLVATMTAPAATVAKAMQKSEVITLARDDGNRTLASDPDAPIQLGEIGMVYDVPLTVLGEQVPHPCDLRDGTPHPVRLDSPHRSVAGVVTREGDALRFDLLETRDTEHLRFVGTLGFGAVRDALPRDLDIHAWTIFPAGSMSAQDGKPSTFATLGDFEDSLAATPAARP